MKNILKIVLFFFVISTLSLSFTSCKVVKQNNGKKKGWYKNTKNPHHPNTTNRNANGNAKKHI